MVEIFRGQELHSRACRGEQLSKEERSELDSWFAAMDSEETKMLRLDLAESPRNEELWVTQPRGINSGGFGVPILANLSRADPFRRCESIDGNCVS